MKKFLSLALTLVCVGAMAQDAVITFTETKHDFGQINEGDGRVTHVFEFKNEGMAPLTLTNVRASCGCTTPDWTKSPVEPGGKGVINVTYNPNGRPGKFNKTITVTSNAKEPTTKLYISGEVIPKTAKPVEKYKIKMGNLNVSQNSVNLSDLRKDEKNGEVKTSTIQYANNTDKPIKVGVQVSLEDQDFIIPELSLTEVGPNQEGTLNLHINAAGCKTWGPVSSKVYVIVDEKKEEANKIVVKTNIVEDFSILTDEQRKNAPILEVPTEINLGTINAGAKVSGNLKVKNSGNNSLIVRRVVNSNDNIQVSNKPTLKGGKSGKINISLSAVDSEGKPQEAGQYSRQIVLITNDPLNSSKKINVVWTVK